MPGNGFSRLAMVFYVSFLFFEPIQAYMLQRFPAAKYLGLNGWWTMAPPCDIELIPGTSYLLGYSHHDELCVPQLCLVDRASRFARGL